MVERLKDLEGHPDCAVRARDVPMPSALRNLQTISPRDCKERYSPSIPRSRAPRFAKLHAQNASHGALPRGLSNDLAAGGKGGPALGALGGDRRGPFLARPRNKTRGGRLSTTRARPRAIRLAAAAAPCGTAGGRRRTHARSMVPPGVSPAHLAGGVLPAEAPARHRPRHQPEHTASSSAG